MTDDRDDDLGTRDDDASTRATSSWKIATLIGVLLALMVLVHLLTR